MTQAMGICRPHLLTRFRSLIKAQICGLCAPGGQIKTLPANISYSVH
jgi:hypothetical protein